MKLFCRTRIKEVTWSLLHLILITERKCRKLMMIMWPVTLFGKSILCPNFIVLLWSAGTRSPGPSTCSLTKHSTAEPQSVPQSVVSLDCLLLCVCCALYVVSEDGSLDLVPLYLLMGSHNWTQIIRVCLINAFTQLAILPGSFDFYFLY